MTQLSEEFVESTKNRNVSPLCGEAVDVYWELIWGLFRDIPGWLLLWDEGTTYKNVKMGLLQVYAYSDTEIRGIMVTRINIFPLCKVLDVVGLSGFAGLEYMDDLDAVAESLARQQGCKYISASAGRGMERILTRRHQGATMASVLFRPTGLLRRS